MEWDEYFVLHAGLVSCKSKDPTTKVGCVIVGPDNEIVSTGFNGFPRGVRETHLIECHGCASRPDRQSSCQVCGGTGGIPTKDLHETRWERPEKYQWVEHAERNAVYNAARIGVSLKGCRAYLNVEPAPCTDCARAFIQSGVIEVIGPDIPFKGVGAGVHYHIHEVTKTMLKEAGLKTRRVKCKT